MWTIDLVSNYLLPFTFLNSRSVAQKHDNVNDIGSCIDANSQEIISENNIPCTIRIGPQSQMHKLDKDRIDTKFARQRTFIPASFLAVFTPQGPN